MPVVIIDVHKAKTQLSKLVELAAAGREFIIAKSGKPMVRVVPLLDAGLHPLGGLRHKANIKLDLKRDFEAEISEMFGLAHQCPDPSDRIELGSPSLAVTL